MDLDSSDGTIETIMKLIENCGMRLTLWNKFNFGHAQQNLAKATLKLKRAHERHLVNSINEEISQARKDVQLWLKIE